jgi:hypothetical protein
MQARGRGGALPPVGIAFEGDLSNRIDAVLAIAMLNGLQARNEARRIALSVSRTSIRAAKLADIVGGFYSGRPVGGSTMVGMPEHGPSDDAPAIAALLDRKAPDGEPLYTSNIERVLDTADNAVLIRNLLLAQNDGNAAIVLAGPATGLVRLMDLFGARPQIEAKCARLVVALGAYPSGAADPSIRHDIEAARRLFAEWPTPIVAVGTEVADAVPYPGASIERDFAWSPAHPVADAYRAYKAMPYDAPASALAAVLYAARPDDAPLTLSGTGMVTVGADGRTTFKAGTGGRHRYVTVDAAQKAELLKAYIELVSAPPAPRPGRRGGPPPAQQQQQQQQQRPPQVPPIAPPAPKPPAP